MLQLVDVLRSVGWLQCISAFGKVDLNGMLDSHWLCRGSVTVTVAVTYYSVSVRYLEMGSHTRSSLSFSRSTANMKSLYRVSGSGRHFAFVPNLQRCLQ